MALRRTCSVPTNVSTSVPDPSAPIEERGVRVQEPGRTGSVAMLAAGQLGATAFFEAPVPALIAARAGGGRADCVAANRAFCRLSGRDEHELAGRDVSELIEGADGLLRALEKAAAPGPVEARCPAGDPEGTRVVLEGVQLVNRDDSPLVMLQVHEMTEADDAQRALRESESRIQDIVDNVSALIYIKHLDGRFILINRHFEEMFGVSRQDAPKCTNYDFFPPAVAAVYSANDRRVLETGVPMEFEEPRPDGGTWLSLKFPLVDDEGRTYGVGGISTDISGRSRAEAAARQAKDEAERANLAKSEFLSRMSHELRTPLNAILGFGQLLEMENLPESAEESVTRIVTAGRHLLALINEVLDISRIEAGGPPTAVEPVHACDPFAEALDLVIPLARERDVTIVRDFHNGLFEFVLADYQRLKQVLLNILTNAVKYNRPEGAVQASFSKAAPERLRFRVVDTGQGIHHDDVDRAFLPFERLGAARTATEGTGLGLALSRSLIEAMGGTIGIERTAPGEGSTFFVELPLTQERQLDPEELVSERSPAIEALTIEGVRTVVYIEDNLPNLDLVETLFSRVGAVTLIPAMQGQLGIELAARHRPQLILLDLHLPDLDGDEVLERLQRDERTKHIPVIVLSADATPTQIERLKARGASDYLTKPLDVPEFLAAVRCALGRQQ
jgi:PAS domain S-box-containing protein